MPHIVDVLIEDSKHDHSYVYAATKKYRSTVFLKLMRQVQSWTKGVRAETLSDDIDFMMTVESRGRSPLFERLSPSEWRRST